MTHYPTEIHQCSNCKHDLSCFRAGFRNHRPLPVHEESQVHISYFLKCIHEWMAWLCMLHGEHDEWYHRSRLTTKTQLKHAHDHVCREIRPWLWLRLVWLLCVVSSQTPLWRHDDGVLFQCFANRVSLKHIFVLLIFAQAHQWFTHIHQVASPRLGHRVLGD